jgi:hypothetical protein
MRMGEASSHDGSDRLRAATHDRLKNGTHLGKDTVLIRIAVAGHNRSLAIEFTLDQPGAVKGPRFVALD